MLAIFGGGLRSVDHTVVEAPEILPNNVNKNNIDTELKLLSTFLKKKLVDGVVSLTNNVHERSNSLDGISRKIVTNSDFIGNKIA